MRSARVLHIIPAPFGDGGIVGGAERYALELARHMAEETPTTLVSFGDVAREETIGALQVKILKAQWYVKGRRTNPVSSALMKELLHADVIHCHQYRVLTSSLASLFSRLIRRRVFVSDLGGGGWDISWYISTERWYHGHLHISQYSRRVSEQEGNRRAHVIMGGVDTEKFAPVIPEGDRTDGVVRFVGRLLPHKGVDDLINAMPPDLPLEIIGHPYDESFLSHLRTLAEGKNVKFRSGCDDLELIAAYRHALCIVLPSVYISTFNGTRSTVPELLGQTLLEGMACGVPAICTNVSSMPEIVEDGVSGFVVPPNDPETLAKKIQWLRDHPAQRDEMGRAARQRILANFTWPNVVQRCLEIYGA